MYEFSQLEFTIRHYVGLEAGIHDDYFTAVMTHDFALLCTAAKAVFGLKLKPDGQKKLKKLLGECLELNEERVRVAHGLWVPFEQGGTVHHTPRASLKFTVREEQAAHLEKQADAANALRQIFEKAGMEKAFQTGAF